MANRIWTRRRMLKYAAGAAAVSAVGTAAYAWRVEPHWVEHVELPLPIRNLPANLDGRRLVQISDLHVGPIVDDDYLKHCLAAVGRLEPDLLVLTGDLVTYVGPQQFEQAARVLEHLRPPSLGAFAVTGNHDYGPRYRHRDVAERIGQVFRESGVRMLRNEGADAAGLRIVGLDDLWSPDFQPTKPIEEAANADASLVLCHNPDAADRPGWGDYRGWILSGHTHGGQCKPPWLEPPILPLANRRYSAGVVPLADGRTIYINRGLGYLRRVRFNARPEITLFTLRRAEVA